MVDSGQLPLRLWVMLREGNESLAQGIQDYRMIGYGDNRLTVSGPSSVSIDGALGSHGAWLLEPYADLPASVGLNTTSIENIVETARIAAENDFQLCVHAIGDRANRETLDIFENAFKGPPRQVRFSGGALSMLSTSILPMFRASGNSASSPRCKGSTVLRTAPGYPID